MDYERWKKKVSEEEWTKIQKEYEESKTKSIKSSESKIKKDIKTKKGNKTSCLGKLQVMVVEGYDRVEVVNGKEKETFYKDDILASMECKKIIRQLRNKEYKEGMIVTGEWEGVITPITDDEDWDFMIKLKLWGD